MHDYVRSNYSLRPIGDRVFFEGGGFFRGGGDFFGGGEVFGEHDTAAQVWLTGTVSVVWWK